MESGLSCILPLEQIPLEKEPTHVAFHCENL